MRSNSQDRADVEQVFSKYLRSLTAADVALASQVWLQSPDVLVVTPIGRFQGWDGVKAIWAKRRRSSRSGRFRPATSASPWQGDAAWLVFDFVFTAKLADGKALHAKGLGESRVSENAATAGALPISTIQPRRHPSPTRPDAWGLAR